MDKKTREKGKLAKPMGIKKEDPCGKASMSEAVAHLNSEVRMDKPEAVDRGND